MIISEIIETAKKNSDALGFLVSFIYEDDRKFWKKLEKKLLKKSWTTLYELKNIFEQEYVGKRN